MTPFPKNIDEFEKLPLVSDELVCKEVAEWGGEWYDSILPENNKLSLKFEPWNKEFKGKLWGKLVPIIGYGGTKKSLLALNIAYENITQGLGSCIYSTMEMGATQIINRLIDMSVEPADGYNPHAELEYHNNKTKKIDAKKFFSTTVAPMFKNRFFITENTSLQTEQYEKLLNKFRLQNKRIDILIVDGLAGMGGKGSETELYSKHSKELKELANKWKILIFLVCHVSKGGSKVDRDLSDKVRSSEKIIDNCDFYITASLFENEDEFNKDFGAMRLVNKRGTGNTLDIVYEFNRLRLLMTDTDFNFKSFDFQVKTNNEF
jgi:archaellum biogenesis ATPase FlaH